MENNKEVDNINHVIDDEPISKSDIAIDEIISGIRDIMGEYICSADKIGKIRNFVESISAGMGANK